MLCLLPWARALLRAQESSRMIPIETVAIFLTASVALALAPDPDNIFVLAKLNQHLPF